MTLPPGGLENLVKGGREAVYGKGSDEMIRDPDFQQKYLPNNPPNPVAPWEWPRWYRQGEMKVKEYRGYKDLGIDPNNWWWSDEGRGQTGYAPYFALLSGGRTGGRKKKKRRRRRMIYRRY